MDCSSRKCTKCLEFPDCFFVKTPNITGCFNSTGIPSDWTQLIEPGDQVFCPTESSQQEFNSNFLYWIIMGTKKTIYNSKYIYLYIFCLGVLLALTWLLVALAYRKKLQSLLSRVIYDSRSIGTTQLEMVVYQPLTNNISIQDDRV